MTRYATQLSLIVQFVTILWHLFINKYNLNIYNILCNIHLCTVIFTWLFAKL